MATDLRELFSKEENETDGTGSGLPPSSNDELHRELAHRALGCVEPEEVLGIIGELNDYHEVDWEPLGGIKGNSGFARGQGMNPMTCLVELPFNCIDTCCERACHEHGITKKGLDEYGSKMEMLRSLGGMTDAEISITAGNPSSDVTNFTIADEGMGVQRDLVEERLLGFIQNGSRKRDLPYAIGRYGAGSTAVFRYCQSRVCKLVLTSSIEQPNEWTWTLVGDIPSEAGHEYGYLTVDGTLPSFTGPVEETLGGGVKARSHGTIVKVYDYAMSMGTKRIGMVDSRFRTKFERNIIESPFAVRLGSYNPNAERKYISRTTRGLITAIEDTGKCIEAMESLPYNVESPFGRLPTKVITYHQDSKAEELIDGELKDHVAGSKKRISGRTRSKDGCVLLHVMGQVHAKRGLSFLQGTCGLPHTGEDTIVIIDLSDIPEKVHEDLFDITRSRFDTHHDNGKTLRNAIVNLLSDDDESQMLRVHEIEEKRRTRAEVKTRENAMEMDLEEEINRNDLLRSKLSGKEYTIDEKSPEIEGVTLEDPPTTFEIIKSIDDDKQPHFYTDDETPVLEIPEYRTRTQSFFLNAAKSYDDRVGVDIEVHGCSSHWKKRGNGKYDLVFDPPSHYSAGDRIEVKCTVVNGEDDELGLRQAFEIEVTEPEKTIKKDWTEDDDDDEPPDTSKSGDSLDLPEVRRASKDEWDDLGMDKKTAVKLQGATGRSLKDVKIIVNIECIQLEGFLDQYNVPPNEKEFLAQTFVRDLAVDVAMTYVDCFDTTNEFDDIGISEYVELIERAASATAYSTLPHAIDDEKLDDWS